VVCQICGQVVAGRDTSIPYKNTRSRKGKENVVALNVAAPGTSVRRLRPGKLTLLTSSSDGTHVPPSLPTTETDDVAQQPIDSVITGISSGTNYFHHLTYMLQPS
jgi:hypothetical protein